MRDYTASVLDGSLSLFVSLLSFVVVENKYGREGLGFFSFVFAVYVLGSYLAELGVSTYVERSVPLLASRPEKEERLLTDAVQTSLILSVLGGVVLLGAFFWPFRLTRMSMDLATLLLLCLALPAHNYNRLRVAALHARGSHETAARLRLVKRLVFMGSVFFMVASGAPLPYLAACFLLPETVVLFLYTRTAGLPSMGQPLLSFERFWDTCKQAQRTLFTDDALEVLLHIDFFVLGLFVSAWEEGVYAKASVLARLFLVVPLSMEPIFRQRYCTLAAEGRHAEMSKSMRRVAARFFFWNSVLLICFILYYETVITFLFPERVQIHDSLLIFQELAVGLLFYASVAAVEPVYEATDRIEVLRKIVVRILILNLALNLYLVPYAGAVGAATASAVSMIAFFLMFGKGPEPLLRLARMKYLCAGAGTYVCYRLFHSLDAPWWLALPGMPVLMWVLLGLSGLFGDGPALEQEEGSLDQSFHQ
jgi:O-antigen/teichoic acid export membrane protein